METTLKEKLFEPYIKAHEELKEKMNVIMERCKINKRQLMNRLDGLTKFSHFEREAISEIMGIPVKKLFPEYYSTNKTNNNKGGKK